MSQEGRVSMCSHHMSSVSRPGTVYVQVPVVGLDLVPEVRHVPGAHPLPPVNLAQEPQPGAGVDKLGHRGHSELVTPQDDNFGQVTKSSPKKEKYFTIQTFLPYLARTEETIWSLNHAVEPN